MADYVYRGNQPYIPLAERIQERIDGLKPCGTYAAYKRHQKLKEPICDDCTEAGSEYNTAQRARRKARKAANDL